MPTHDENKFIMIDIFQKIAKGRNEKGEIISETKHYYLACLSTNPVTNKEYTFSNYESFIKKMTAKIYRKTYLLNINQTMPLLIQLLNERFHNVQQVSENDFINSNCRRYTIALKGV